MNNTKFLLLFSSGVTQPCFLLDVLCLLECVGQYWCPCRQIHCDEMTAWISLKSGSRWDCWDTGVHDPVTAYRPIFLVLKSHFKEQDTVREVSCLISYNYSFRHPARHVQTGYAALGKVHVCYIYWTKWWRKLYCIYIQTMWVSEYAW